MERILTAPHSSGASASIRRIQARLPLLTGNRVDIVVRPSLTAYRGKLLSGRSKGSAVHAGCFLSKRRIVLEEELLLHPCDLDRILIHEVFHFAWWHLGNTKRWAFEQLLQDEMNRHARGELGWSAESIKQELTPNDIKRRTRRWRAYACESFCDTGGWAFGGSQTYSEITLAERFRLKRRSWIESHIGRCPLSI